MVPEDNKLLINCWHAVCFMPAKGIKSSHKEKENIINYIIIHNTFNVYQLLQTSD